MATTNAIPPEAGEKVVEVAEGVVSPPLPGNTPVYMPIIRP